VISKRRGKSPLQKGKREIMEREGPVLTDREEAIPALVSKGKKRVPAMRLEKRQA